MAKQDLGKILPTFNGIYNANIVYEKLCIVNYNGSVYVSKKDIPKGTDISNEEYWYLLIEKLKKGIDYFTEEDRKAIIDEVTKLAESDFNKYYDEKKKALDKVASDNTTAFLKVVKDNTNDFNSNVDTQTKAFDTHYDEKVKSFDENSDKQTKAYDINANNKLNDYNENHKIKMQELDDEAKVKIAEYDEHAEELRNMAISTDNELKRVKNEILDTGSASDSFVNVEDSCMAKIKELEIEGVLQQNTTTGKNLLPNNATSQTINGINYTVNSDGSVYAKGTATARSEFNIYNKPFTLNANTEYKFQSDILMVISTTTGHISGKKGQTFTSESEISALSVYIRVENGTSIDKKIYPMITLVGANSTYEPYTGGQLSPNPDYPQEIKTITNSLKITSCGRNLLKNMATSATVNGVSFTVNDDGSVLANGTATADAVFKILPIATTFSQNLILPPNKTYTLSDSVGNYTDYFTQVVIQDANGNKNWYNTAGSIDISTNVIACLYTAQIYVRKNKTVNNVLFKPQLVVKDSANLFEPYIESQIQAKLPEDEFIGKLDDTHKDILRAEYFPEKGQYHLVLDKKVGKYVFTGNENIVLFSSVNDINQYYYILNTCLSITNQQLNNIYVISNYFQGVEWQNSWTKNNTITIGSNKRLFIYSKEFTSIDDLKNFLSTNAVEVYYPLKTPYTLDLCTIDMPLAYKKVTNIFTNSDLLPKITAKYYRTFQTTIQNLQINDKTLKQEITDLNNSISDISKRLEALESANVSTVEESEASNDLQN